ncbi:MAG TPA: peptidoglycan DD-metalloendopeptidase family protein [Candidatus Binatia bacterium]|nr:peptidoglycan DD-metalloendopeptidase family protein [Candidatus Binatia bacterium]
MSDTVLAVATRVQELETILDRLAGPWAAPLSSMPASPVVGVGLAGSDVSLRVGDAGAPAWTAPFAAILGGLAGTVDPTRTLAVDPLGGTTVVEPVPGGRISQPYRLGSASSAVGGEAHDGLDIAAPLGTPVRAMAGGVVRFAGRLDDGAVVVRIEHADGSQAWYGHLDPSLEVRVGDRVTAGQVLGRIGLTGRTTGPHLHLEVRVGGRPVDPEIVLRTGRLPGAVGAPDPGAALRRFEAVAPTIPYADEIRAAAVEAGIDPLLLAALVRTESGFRPTAVSRAGAMGLTQLMPATARSLGVADPFDPASNLAGGARYLAGNLRIFGRVDLALAAYQAGKAAVRRAGGVPDSPVTQTYVARVLETWAGYLTAAEERR